MPQFEWMEELLVRIESTFHLKGNASVIVGFEQNPYLKGLNFFSVLFNVIQFKQVLNIRYQGFKQENPVDSIIHPYYLKQYNNRWFLFGYNSQLERISNLAIDRIVSIFDTNQVYIENYTIDFEEYFDDVIGVTIPQDGKIEQITLRFSPERIQYVLSKPLHHSQKITNKENGIIQISVIPNKELDSLILSFGNQVEVISPQYYREQIYNQITDLFTKYSPVHNDCTNI